VSPELPGLGLLARRAKDDVPAAAGRGIQSGAPDVLSYGEMLNPMASVRGLRDRPRVTVRVISPWLSSLWIGLVRPVDAGVGRPLVEGLAVPTVASLGSLLGGVKVGG